MKKHIFFNLPDKPENMGQSQLADDALKFAKERKEFLPNPKIEGNRLTFDVKVEKEGEEPTTRRGFAIVTDVEDDFQN